MNNQRFIIIGGMGPQASLQLHGHLLDTHQKPDDYPMITHLSLPVPDFITDTEQIPAALDLINGSLAYASYARATAIGLACNTAHLLADQIEACKGDNFVSMIDAVVDTITTRGFKTVGLLASPMTIDKRLYHERFEPRGITVLTPDIEYLPGVAIAIRHVLTGKDPRTKHAFLSSLAQKLEKKGADCILLGCTELPLIGVTCNIPEIDSLSCLAKGMLQRQSEVY